MLTEKDGIKAAMSAMVTAKKVLKDVKRDGGGFMNFALLLKSDGLTVPPLPLNFKDDDDKDFKIMLLKAIAKESRAEMLVLVNDVFYVKSEKKDLGMSASEHPDKEEALSVTYEVKTKKGYAVGSILSPYTMIDGKLEFKEEVMTTNIEKGNISGRMTGLLYDMFNEDYSEDNNEDTCSHGNSWSSNCSDCNEDALTSFERMNKSDLN